MATTVEGFEDLFLLIFVSNIESNPIVLDPRLGDLMFHKNGKPR